MIMSEGNKLPALHMKTKTEVAKKLFITRRCLQVVHDNTVSFAGKLEIKYVFLCYLLSLRCK